jgi:hypothetical protein
MNNSMGSTVVTCHDLPTNSPISTVKIFPRTRSAPRVTITTTNRPDEVLRDIRCLLTGHRSLRSSVEEELCMGQSRTRMQKVAHCHVHIIHPFGFRHHRGIRKSGRYQVHSIKSSKPILVDYTTLWRLRATLEHHP